MGFRSILNFAHLLITERARPGDCVIDATVGNGVDTCFLAELVGPKGKVYGFDIQGQALENTAERLRARAVEKDSVHLLLRSHAEMLEAVPAVWHGKVTAVMFNLGYLPGTGGDEVVITVPASTLPALEAALALLRPGGIATVGLYLRHAGGLSEAEAVHAFAAALPQERYQVLSYQFINQQHQPPYLIAIEKL